MTSKDKILDAAVLVLSDFGYSGATTKQIAMRAGVNEITLFRLFGSKLNLLTEVVKHYSFTLTVDIDFKKFITWDIQTDLIHIGQSFYEMLTKNIRVILMIITESQRNSQIKEIIAAVPDRQNEVLAWYFDEQIKKGNCRKMKDPKFAAQSFFALFFEYCISENMVSGSERKDSKEIAIQFVDLFLYGIVARHK